VKAVVNVASAVVKAAVNVVIGVSVVVTTAKAMARHAMPTPNPK
jgi:hypothetical protein